MAAAIMQAATATAPAARATDALRERQNKLKTMLRADSVTEQFRNALGKHGDTFVASIIDLYNSDSKLQQCNPAQVVAEALKAATLKLPINKQLGFAYIIPFNNSKQAPDGSWQKVLEPTFQIGYKGYIQLAMRSGQYRILNSDVVYEGEISTVNKLTGEITITNTRKSDSIVGYFAHEELTNGFRKTLYMSVPEMAAHAKRYSKGIPLAATVEKLVELASQPFNPNSEKVGWIGNFHAMALKTVVRLLLSKYGYLSIEMADSMAKDIEGDTTLTAPEDRTEEAVFSEVETTTTPTPTPNDTLSLT